MKKGILFSVLMVLSIFAIAQAPESFNYQVVVRDGSTNSPLTNQNVSFKMSILKGSSSGESQYSELHSANTGALGLVNLVIGNGTDKAGTISAIDWGADTYYLKVEIDKTGGTTYVEMGTTQLLSVPYALYSKTAYTVSDVVKVTGDQTIEGNKTFIGTTTVATPVNTTDASTKAYVDNTVGQMGISKHSLIEIRSLSPFPGQMVYNTTQNVMLFYNGSNWQNISGGCWPIPEVANAGIDQTLTNGTTQASMSANAPILGDGQWNIIFGSGGSFDDLTKPDATFTGQMHSYYELEWTISTDCSQTSDRVNIRFTSLVSDYDNNSYHTIKIGEQIWMVENLNVTHYSNGDEIPYITIYDHSTWGSLTSGAYCDVMENENNEVDFGKLYNGYSVVDSRKLCPIGWHMPTDSEWTYLENILGGASIAGGKLREAGTSHWLPPNTDATNESGFTAIPAGSRIGEYNLQTDAIFWTSSENGPDLWIRGIETGTEVERESAEKMDGLSVRCLKD
jgi:uncharacterized protein (TIGR02145 family)